MKEIRLKEGFQGEHSYVLPPASLEKMQNDQLMTSLFLTAIGYYPKAQNHYRKRDVPIGEYILLYCVEGEGWVELDGSHYVLYSNCYMIIPPGVKHAYGSSASHPWSLYWIHFSGSGAEDLCGSHIKQVQQITLENDSRIAQRLKLFDEIVHTLSMGNAFPNLRYACAVFQHFMASFIYVVQYRQSLKKGTQEYDDPVSDCIHYMKEHIERRLTIKEISDYVGYSPSRLTALFNEKTHLAPMLYFNQIKIQHACHWLDNTDMKVKQISLRLGFEDVYYFSRLFKQIMGMSPRDYRNRSFV